MFNTNYQSDRLMLHTASFEIALPASPGVSTGKFLKVYSESECLFHVVDIDGKTIASFPKIGDAHQYARDKAANYFH